MHRFSAESVCFRYPRQDDKKFILQKISRRLIGRQSVTLPWDLEDISFVLNAGEAVAIVGPNGAGKSTLLRLLAGVLVPGKGKVVRNGTVQSLIELGIQIEHALTGRENVALACALNYISAEERPAIEARVEDIAALGAAFDHPARTYSTGMKARLSFALALALEPAILLVDEVLAVGDLAFQRKSMALIKAYVARGGSIVFVSHDAAQIHAACSRAILLHDGRILQSGPTPMIISRYYELISTQATNHLSSDTKQCGQSISGVSISTSDGSKIRTGSAVDITVDIKSDRAIEVGWGVNFLTQLGALNVAGDMMPGGVFLVPGFNRLHCRIPELTMMPGDYRVAIALLETDTMIPFDLVGWYDANHIFKVHGSGSKKENLQLNIQQLVSLNAEWSCK